MTEPIIIPVLATDVSTTMNKNARATENAARKADKFGREQKQVAVDTDKAEKEANQLTGALARLGRAYDTLKRKAGSVGGRIRSGAVASPNAGRIGAMSQGFAQAGAVGGGLGSALSPFAGAIGAGSAGGMAGMVATGIGAAAVVAMVAISALGAASDRAADAIEASTRQEYKLKDMRQAAIDQQRQAALGAANAMDPALRRIEFRDRNASLFAAENRQRATEIGGSAAAGAMLLEQSASFKGRGGFTDTDMRIAALDVAGLVAKTGFVGGGDALKGVTSTQLFTALKTGDIPGLAARIVAPSAGMSVSDVRSRFMSFNQSDIALGVQKRDADRNKINVASVNNIEMSTKLLSDQVAKAIDPFAKVLSDWSNQQQRELLVQGERLKAEYAIVGMLRTAGEVWGFSDGSAAQQLRRKLEQYGAAMEALSDMTPEVAI